MPPVTTSLRIGLFCFQAGGRKRSGVIWYGCMLAFCRVTFSFSVLCQEIGWEERLFCVEWDMKCNHRYRQQRSLLTVDEYLRSQSW